MLRSLWLLLLYLSFLGLGVASPFVMTLGYVWVDTFQPQAVAYIILNELPVAMIMGVGAFASYFLFDRRSPPPLMLQSALQVMLAVWMTATLVWAELPDRALVKWTGPSKPWCSPRSCLWSSGRACRSRHSLRPMFSRWPPISCRSDLKF